ncbi:MAG: phage recombination protein Bet [Mycobacterium sp.]|nr:phage recombination protein Bet [Mycobacterium sp.]
MTETEKVTQRPAGALAVRPTQTDWTDKQLAALQALGIDDSVTAGDLQVFLTYAQRTGLDPFARQIYLIKRRQREPSGQWVTRWSIQCGIDGFRVIANRSGKYRGQTPAEWCDESGVWVDVWLKPHPPAAARAGVYHADYPNPLYAVATWGQYAALTSKGDPAAMWGKMPALMLHKCAEALALRRAFPNDLSGIYIAEEMDQQGPAELPKPPQPRPILELMQDADTATDVAVLQSLWREAAAAGVLDDTVTVNKDTGEATSFREHLLALVHNMKDSDVSPGGEPEAIPPGDTQAGGDDDG